MKTIHVLIVAVAVAAAPFAVRAQSATGATTEPAATTEPVATDAAAADDTDGTDMVQEATGSLDQAQSRTIGSTGTGTGDVGSTGTGTGDVGSTGTGTGDIGSTGTGTGDVGSTGTGTGDVGSTGTGTGTNAQSAASSPTLTLIASRDAIRTPGGVEITATLAADASRDPAEVREFTLPITSSSASCIAPASVVVAWTAAKGGSASFPVKCGRSGAQVVTISSGGASATFTTR